MAGIRKRFGKINFYTLLKYFLSYFFLLSFLLAGFFVAYRNQLRTTYYTERDNSIQEKLLLFQQSFNNDLDHVYNVHYNLCNNMNLKMLSFSPKSTWYSSLCVRDMRGFVGANSLLSDIIYIDRNSGNILACQNYIYQSGEDYYLGTGKKRVKLPVGKYGHDSRNSVVYIKQQDQSLLLLFPNVESKRYELFYVINSGEIITQCNNMLSEEISGVYLMDYENHVIAAAGEQKVPMPSGRIDLLKLEKRDEGDQMIYTLPLHANLYLTVCFSKDVLLKYAEKAFLNMYMIVAGIGCIGLLLILFGMKLTYTPLFRLSRKFAGMTDGGGKGLELQLDQAFSSVLQEQEKLQERIDKYHTIMKESIFDAIVNENSEEIAAENMDRIFDGEPGRLVFVMKIAPSADGKWTGREAEEFQRFFLEAFPNHDAFCIRLETAAKYASYLIYYGGKDQDKISVMKYLLTDHYKDSGYRIALSNGSGSPLDIPALYTNAVQASNFWETDPIAFYDEMDIHEIQTEAYLSQELSGFSSLLEQMKFKEARAAIRRFFEYLDKTQFPNFYTRSMLTEALTTIITNMNQQNIRFTVYNNLYFETLYFIRSFSYESKSAEIYDHFVSLIEVFEKELSNLTIKSGELQEFVDTFYASSEISIAMLAEKFHVSIAYMSYLFKKNFNENFSDYLWNLRVAKAKELLRTTTKPVEEICLEVGYENVSSFRRKFKKELGITPSQYRNGEEPEET